MKMTLNFGTVRTYAVALITGVVLLAGYSQKAEAAPCAITGTYADLVAVVSCEIGDKTFSDFTFLTADPVVASGIAYSATNGIGGFWGFTFGFSLTATQADTDNDFLITYNIACTNRSFCIDSIHGEIVGGGISGGIVSLAETYTGTNGIGFAILVLPGGPASFDHTFTPVASLHVAKDINAHCSGNDPLCFATISGVINTVDQVPEPASLALVATGLVGLGWFGRRRRHQT